MSIIPPRFARIGSRFFPNLLTETRRIPSPPILSRLLALSLAYALLLQFLPCRALAAANYKNAAAEKRSSKLINEKSQRFFGADVNGGFASVEPRAFLPDPQSSATNNSVTDTIISRHKPVLNSGRIEGTLRVLLPESFTINGNSQITSDLFLPGSPTITTNGGAQYGGTVSDGGTPSPNNYTLTLSGGVNLAGKIHTGADAIQLPNFPNSVPSASGTRTVSVTSQSGVANIGNWQTVRDLNVTGSHITIDVPPGNYGTFTVNGNSQLRLSAGTYNFTNTFNLDGSATVQTTGLVTINVRQNLIVNSGAITLGSYTSPGDVTLNVMGATVNVNGSSQITGLLHAYNATTTINGTAQVRGQIIANALTLNNSGKVIGAVWPANSTCPTIFGPRRFDRTTGLPNQYVEQFSLPSGFNSPFTLHIQNGSLDGTQRVSSATVKLNGIDLLTPSDLNQNVASVDRTVNLATNNQLDVRVASDPGSYLIINLCGTVPVSDTTPPAVTITSPENNSTTTQSAITVSGTATDNGAGATGVAHVYVNDTEASYNSAAGTWTITNVSLALGDNQIVVRAIDQAGNQSVTTIKVNRQSPQNHAPTADSGPDQTLTLPNTATLQGTAADDGFPEGSTLTTTWSKVNGPGTVTFGDATLLNTTASFDISGSYVLRLTASDSALSTSDDITITVQPQNQPPTVSAGPDQMIALPHTATLNGTVTDDALPAGNAVTSTWSGVSGPGTVIFEDATLTDTNATFSAPGTYVLRLTASDGELSAKSDVTITVQPENHAPTVSAGANQTVSLPNATAQLAGSTSDDGLPFGSSLTVSWSPVSGGPITFDDPNSPITTAHFTVAGVYVLRLTATDGELSSTGDVTVTVTPPNQAPVVDAGSDQSIVLPNVASLNGTVGDDGLPLGGGVSTLWTQVSGPGTVTFANPSVTVTTASFSAAGTYVLRLTASDSQLASNDDITITVDPQNQPPVVSAGTDQTITLPSNANLNGAVTDDGWPRGSSVSILWSKISGPGTVTFANPNSATTTASFSEPGAYVLQLTANDSQLSTSDDLSVIVIPENHAPTANAGPDQTITLPNQATLNGSVSDDGQPSGGTLTSIWTQVSGPGIVSFATPNAAITTASFSQAGNYVLRLSATDSQLSSSDDIQLTVIPENHAPTSNAGADQEITLPNVATLNGAVSDDGLPSGSTLTGTWSKVSGPGTVTFANPNAAVTTAAFSEAGTYVLRLTANDSQLSASDDVQITVIPENHAPTANAGPDQQITLPNVANLNGTVSDDGLPSGSTINSTWSKVSGPGTVTFANPNVTVSTATFGAPGLYVLRLTANDSQLSSSDDVQITVIPGNQVPTVSAGPDQFSAWPERGNAKIFLMDLNGNITKRLTFSATDDYNGNWSPQNNRIVFISNRDGNFEIYVMDADGKNQTRLTNNTAFEISPTWSPDGTKIIYTSNEFGQNDIFVMDADGSNKKRLTTTTADDTGGVWRPKIVNGQVTNGDEIVFATNRDGFREIYAMNTDGSNQRRLTNNTPPDDAPVWAPDGSTIAFASVRSGDSDLNIYLMNPDGSNVRRIVNNPGDDYPTDWSRDGAKLAWMNWTGSNADVYTANADGSQVTRLTSFSGEDAVPAFSPDGQQLVMSSRGEGVYLAGSVADDGLPNGTLSAAWSKVSGPGNVTFANPATAKTQANFSAPGTYVLRLTASDSALSASDDVTITINQAPSVNAGVDQNITSCTVNLQGTATDDGIPAGSSLAISWSKVSGPGIVTFANPASLATTASFSAPGNYVLRLTGSDSNLEGSDDLAITVVFSTNNTAPVVAAGPDQNIVAPATTATLNGSVADDGLPACGSLVVSWSQVSGPSGVTFANANSAATTATFPGLGTYVLRLTANDSAITSTDDVSIVIANNQPPAADFGLASNKGPVPLTTVSFSGYRVDGSETYHPKQLLDTNVSSYWWSAIGQVSNQSMVFGTSDGQAALIDRVRLQHVFNDGTDVNQFEIQVSSATANAADFHSVLIASMANNPALQEFVFPGGPATARYIKLILISNNGSSVSTILGTFQAISFGGFDSIVSFLGKPNSALNQSPVLIQNGGAIYDFSYGGGNDTPDRMLGYARGGWVTTSTTNQFAIIQLGGNKVQTIDGVKITPWYDFGFGGTGVKDFEIWVSATTPDPAAFTRVLAATVIFNPQLQTFMFPSGPVQARYVKYVPLSNHAGTGTQINTQNFDVIVEGTARVIAASGQDTQQTSPAENAFDGLNGSNWFSQNGAVTDVWVKTSLEDETVHKVRGVRINPVNDFSFGTRGPKDFDIRVSTTTTDDSAFATVYSGTMSNVIVNTDTFQDFIFPTPVDARYVQFYWKNGYSTANIGVRELVVLADSAGANIVGYSSTQDALSYGPENALDIDTLQPWRTGNSQTTNQWLKLSLPGSDLYTIDHVALMSGSVACGFTCSDFNVSPKDFELQVSTTDANDSSFTTVFSGTQRPTNLLQHYSFPPIQARYVRLLMKNNWGSNLIALNGFYVYTTDHGGTDPRFIDRSTDSDGHVVAWSWDFGDGGTSNLQSPSHHYAAAGTYTITLTVTDDAGATATHQGTLKVSSSFVAPSFAFSPMISSEGAQWVRFTDTTPSMMQDLGHRVFDIGNGSVLDLQQATYFPYLFPDSGTYNITMRLGDDNGLKAIVTQSMTVRNFPPSVSVQPGKAVVWGEQWTNAPQISDPSSIDNQSLHGVWDFGDGQTATCNNCNNTSGTITHAYATPGVYNAILTVTDKDGGAASATATYTVNRRPTALIFPALPRQSSGPAFITHATLMDTFANVPLAGKPVQFKINGASFNAVTAANGVAEVSAPMPAGTRIDIVTAAFAQDSFYLAAGGVGIPDTAGSLPPNTTPTSGGTNFWLMFPRNYSDGLSALQRLYITSPVDTTGTVTIPGSNFSQNFTVQANTVTTVELGFVQVTQSDVIENKGIHVTSAQPITVYGMNQRVFTSDGYLALPVDGLGKDHYVLTYGNNGFAPDSQVGIVASENTTTVTITPAVTSGARIGGVPYTITLNQGQTYVLRNSDPTPQGDMTGTRVSSDKPIAVFGAHEAAQIPFEAGCCSDHLVEQLPPTNVWGKRFATIPIATRTKGDFFRIVAAEDNTEVYLDGSLIATLNHGQWVERISKNPTEIIATKPIMVAQLATSIFYDPGTTGKADPFMMIIPPYSQFLNHYTVTTPTPNDFTTFEINYANVVAPTDWLGEFTLDGEPIPDWMFTPIGVSGFSGAQVPITKGPHSFDGPVSFGLFIYGFSKDEGYGYPGGMNLSPVTQDTNVIVSPETLARPINGQACFVATITNQAQSPLGGRTVNFSATGANTANGSVSTNANGQAQFCYTGTNQGTDLLRASVDSVSATASVQWLTDVPNLAPVVDAGNDQTITLPAPAVLDGLAIDDGLPSYTLNSTWSKVSGPGTVTFINPSSLSTNATFNAAGVYVLRLSVTDSSLTSTDDVQITVCAQPHDQLRL